MLHLITKAQKGDDQAFLHLFQAYEQDIYRIAFIYVKNQNDALDVVQETAYRSFKSIKTLKEPTYFKTWLLRIAIRCSLDILRKQKPFIEINASVEDFTSPDMSEDVISEITVQTLMDDLDDEEKSVILLRFYEDLTLKEISETLHIPLSTAKTILYRALKKLRQKAEGADYNE